jgi:hypothetical protein
MIVKHGLWLEEDMKEIGKDRKEECDMDVWSDVQRPKKFEKLIVRLDIDCVSDVVVSTEMVCARETKGRIRMTGWQLVGN